MPGKAARGVVWLLTVAVTVVTLGAAMPHTNLDHITLHLQPEILRGHRFVLTLEPLPDPSTRSLNTAKSLNSNQTLANSTREEDEDPTLPTTTDENDVAVSTTPMPDTTTESTDGTTAAVTLVSPFILKNPPFSVEADVDELLITIPDIQCPQGLRPDPSGRCRPLFGPSVNRGRSISGVFVPPFDFMRARGNSLFKISEKLQRHPDSKNIF